MSGNEANPSLRRLALLPEKPEPDAGGLGGQHVQQEVAALGKKAATDGQASRVLWRLTGLAAVVAIGPSAWGHSLSLRP
jgi:hypothetical protein